MNQIRVSLSAKDYAASLRKYGVNTTLNNLLFPYTKDASAIKNYSHDAVISDESTQIIFTKK